MRLFLQQLKLALPDQPPPRLSAGRKLDLLRANVVKTFRERPRKMKPFRETGTKRLAGMESQAKVAPRCKTEL